MPTPLIFDRTTFNNIPTDHGIYAFFLNFEFIVRTIKARATPTTDLTPFVDKAVRAHTTGNPDRLDLRLFRKKTFTSVLSLEATHEIRCGATAPGLTAADILTTADVLEKCSLFAGPLYIGIAEKQTLRKRFGQHRKSYERYKKSLAGTAKPKGRDMFQRGGKFYERLVRRRLEFRDLLYACVPLTPAELAQVRYVEKLLHALAMPAMSESH
jgi:hypothetical protein